MSRSTSHLLLQLRAENVQLRHLLVEALDLSDAAVPRAPKEVEWRKKCADMLGVHISGEDPK